MINLKISILICLILPLISLGSPEYLDDPVEVKKMLKVGSQQTKEKIFKMVGLDLAYYKNSVGTQAEMISTLMLANNDISRTVAVELLSENKNLLKEPVIAETVKKLLTYSPGELESARKNITYKHPSLDHQKILEEGLRKSLKGLLGGNVNSNALVVNFIESKPIVNIQKGESSFSIESNTSPQEDVLLYLKKFPNSGFGKVIGEMLISNDAETVKRGEVYLRASYGVQENIEVGLKIGSMLKSEDAKVRERGEKYISSYKRVQRNPEVGKVIGEMLISDDTRTVKRGEAYLRARYGVQENIEVGLKIGSMLKSEEAKVREQGKKYISSHKKVQRNPEVGKVIGEMLISDDTRTVKRGEAYLRAHYGVQENIEVGLKVGSMLRSEEAKIRERGRRYISSHKRVQSNPELGNVIGKMVLSADPKVHEVGKKLISSHYGVQENTGLSKILVSALASNEGDKKERAEVIKNNYKRVRNNISTADILNEKRRQALQGSNNSDGKVEPKPSAPVIAPKPVEKLPKISNEQVAKLIEAKDPKAYLYLNQNPNLKNSYGIQKALAHGFYYNHPQAVEFVEKLGLINTDSVKERIADLIELKDKRGYDLLEKYPNLKNNYGVQKALAHGFYYNHPQAVEFVEKLGLINTDSVKEKIADLIELKDKRGYDLLEKYPNLKNSYGIQKALAHGFYYNHPQAVEFVEKLGLINTDSVKERIADLIELKDKRGYDLLEKYPNLKNSYGIQKALAHGFYYNHPQAVEFVEKLGLINTDSVKERIADLIEHKDKRGYDLLEKYPNLKNNYGIQKALAHGFYYNHPQALELVEKLGLINTDSVKERIADLIEHKDKRGYDLLEKYPNLKNSYGIQKALAHGFYFNHPQALEFVEKLGLINTDSVKERIADLIEHKDKRGYDLLEKYPNLKNSYGIQKALAHGFYYNHPQALEFVEKNGMVLSDSKVKNRAVDLITAGNKRGYELLIEYPTLLNNSNVQEAIGFKQKLEGSSAEVFLRKINGYPRLLMHETILKNTVDLLLRDGEQLKEFLTKHPKIIEQKQLYTELYKRIAANDPVAKKMIRSKEGATLKEKLLVEVARQLNSESIDKRAEAIKLFSNNKLWLRKDIIKNAIALLYTNHPAEVESLINESKYLKRDKSVIDAINKSITSENKTSRSSSITILNNDVSLQENKQVQAEVAKGLLKYPSDYKGLVLNSAEIQKSKVVKKAVNLMIDSQFIEKVDVAIELIKNNSGLKENFLNNMPDNIKEKLANRLLRLIAKSDQNSHAKKNVYNYFHFMSFYMPNTLITKINESTSKAQIKDIIKLMQNSEFFGKNPDTSKVVAALYKKYPEEAVKIISKSKLHRSHEAITSVIGKGLTSNSMNMQKSSISLIQQYPELHKNEAINNSISSALKAKPTLALEILDSQRNKLFENKLVNNAVLFLLIKGNNQALDFVKNNENIFSNSRVQSAILLSALNGNINAISEVMKSGDLKDRFLKNSKFSETMGLLAKSESSKTKKLFDYYPELKSHLQTSNEVALMKKSQLNIQPKPPSFAAHFGSFIAAQGVKDTVFFAAGLANGSSDAEQFVEQMGDLASVDTLAAYSGFAVAHRPFALMEAKARSVGGVKGKLKGLGIGSVGMMVGMQADHIIRLTIEKAKKKSREKYGASAVTYTPEAFQEAFVEVLHENLENPDVLAVTVGSFAASAAIMKKISKILTVTKNIEAGVATTTTALSFTGPAAMLGKVATQAGIFILAEVGIGTYVKFKTDSEFTKEAEKVSQEIGKLREELNEDNAVDIYAKIHEKFESLRQLRLAWLINRNSKVAYAHKKYKEEIEGLDELERFLDYRTEKDGEIPRGLLQSLSFNRCLKKMKEEKLDLAKMSCVKETTSEKSLFEKVTRRQMFGAFFCQHLSGVHMVENKIKQLEKRRINYEQALKDSEGRATATFDTKVSITDQIYKPGVTKCRKSSKQCRVRFSNIKNATIKDLYEVENAYLDETLQKAGVDVKAVKGKNPIFNETNITEKQIKFREGYSLARNNAAMAKGLFTSAKVMPNFASDSERMLASVSAVNEIVTHDEDTLVDYSGRVCSPTKPLISGVAIPFTVLQSIMKNDSLWAKTGDKYIEDSKNLKYGKKNLCETNIAHCAIAHAMGEQSSIKQLTKNDNHERESCESYQSNLSKEELGFYNSKLLKFTENFILK